MSNGETDRNATSPESQATGRDDRLVFRLKPQPVVTHDPNGVVHVIPATDPQGRLDLFGNPDTAADVAYLDRRMPRAELRQAVDHNHQFDQHIAAHHEAQKQLVLELSNVIFHAENSVHRNNPIQTSQNSNWLPAYQAVANFLTQKGYHPDSPGIDYILMTARPTNLGSRFSIYNFLDQWAHAVSHQEVGPNLDTAQTRRLMQALGVELDTDKH